MSYILDALKKAESERKLGSIPNVYAQPPGTNVNAGGTGRSWLPWLLSLGMFAILLAGIAWLQPWRSGSVPRQNPVQPALANTPTFSPVNDVPPPANRPKIEAVAVPATKNTDVPHANLPKPTAAIQPLAQAGLPPSTPEAVRATTPPIPETGPAEEKPVGTLQDLPDNIQRELPAVAVNGYIYARNPADRTVLINNRLLHEGDQIGPDLTLEKMTPKGAVLNYKGYRYRLAY